MLKISRLLALNYMIALQEGKDWNIMTGKLYSSSQYIVLLFLFVELLWMYVVGPTLSMMIILKEVPR